MKKTDLIDSVTKGHITAIDRALSGSNVRKRKLENILISVRHHLVLLDYERKTLKEICAKWAETAKAGEIK